jgi:hypothetical protein
LAEALKILGQSNPALRTLTDLYTVPASTSTTVSTLVICNTDNNNATFRVAVAAAGAADERKQYLFYDTLVLKNDSIPVTIGITLGATDVLRVYADSSKLAFTAFGVELS